MPRYKLTIEYDGTPFAGWQVQRNAPSVQESLQLAIQRLSGEDFIPRGAGRTDSGVHALGQVAHIDLTRDWPPETVRDALNFHLKPAPIAVLTCELASPEFDARFSAQKRHYLYRILNRHARPVIEENRAWHVRHPLDAAAMQEAAQTLIGRHDFTTFRASACQAKSPIKTLDVLQVAREGEFVTIRASARSFLHHQVRSITGSLKHVGEGKWTPEDMRAALEACDRKRCGALAPSCGLYLVLFNNRRAP
ncbi:MAG: tRNA pseudouridine(38-40) synthase TruA, partial [Alphaproteobacteria bacterium]